MLVPGKSLGGLRLGMTEAQVRVAWGGRYGRCSNCVEPTWYFNYRKFEPDGAGVSFRRGRVDAIFTLWSPAGWHTDRKLRIGDAAPLATQLYGPLLTVHCGSYDALLLPKGRTQTELYVFDRKIWGFGLSSAGVPACH